MTATPKDQITGPWMNKFSALDPTKELTEKQFNYAKTALLARRATRADKASGATGPTTEEGKRISSQNARKHGYAGAQMIIQDEDKAAYDAHLAAYAESFRPENQVECDTVRLAANSMWRIDRLTSIESGLIELEMDHHSVHIDAVFKDVPLNKFMAIGFMEHTNDTTALELCRRYLASAQRDFQRAIDLFYKLKANRAAATAPKTDDGPQKIHVVSRQPNELPEKPSETPILTPHVAGTRKLSRAERRRARR